MQSYGRTSKFFRLDGLLPFCIVMELRSASSASKVEGARKLKHHAVEIFNRVKFTLHKWHSNVPELEITVPMTSLPFLNSSLVYHQFVESANYWDSKGTKWMTFCMFHSHLRLLH